MKVIGLTGGMGSGKTTVAAIFNILDVPVYNSDLMAKKLMETNEELKSKLIDQFGDSVYYPDGTINRSYFAECIFTNSKSLQLANSIIHPYVIRDFKTWLSQKRNSFVLIESAILSKVKKYLTIHKIIAVTTTRAVALQRIKERDQLDETAILKRMQWQNEEIEFIMRSDYLIENSGNQSIVRQAIAVYHKLMQLP